MKFQVTQEHIKNGKRECSESCAIALCLKEQYPTKTVLVEDACNVWLDNTRYYADKHVNDFIDAFDKGIAVSPIEFELEKVFGDD